jgi:hypothetical protein
MVLIASAGEALRTYEVDWEGGQAATDGTTWLSDPTHHRSSSFEAPGLLIRKRDLPPLREDPFTGGFWGILL